MYEPCVSAQVAFGAQAAAGVTPFFSFSQKGIDVQVAPFPVKPDLQVQTLPELLLKQVAFASQVFVPAAQGLVETQEVPLPVNPGLQAHI